MPSSPRPARVVGAYAAQPDSRDALPAFLREVLALPAVDGLEISWGSPTWEEDRLAVEAASIAAGPTARHVVTIVGAGVSLAAADPTVGLASPDDAGRRRALDLVEAARIWIRAMAARGVTIVAIELHSFPTVAPDAAEAAGRALARSLREIAAADWGDTAIAVEHCDARGGPHVWRKGLLPLDVEIAAVTEARAAGGVDLGIALNWGRSAIEERDARAPERHAARLAGLGLLRGVIFSGATDRDGPFGEAWSDAHPPFRAQEATSTMDRDRVEATLAAAGGGLLWEGVKIAVRPPTLSAAERLATLREAVAHLG